MTYRNIFFLTYFQLISGRCACIKMKYSWCRKILTELHRMFSSVCNGAIFVINDHLISQNKVPLWFQIQFLEPQISETAIHTISQAHFSRRERYASILGTPDHKRRKQKMKNRQASIFGTPKHERRKKRMKSHPAVTVGTPEYEKHKEKVNLKKHQNKANSDSLKIQSFKKAIQEGPFFVYVACNQCLYKQSV